MRQATADRLTIGAHMTAAALSIGLFVVARAPAATTVLCLLVSMTVMSPAARRQHALLKYDRKQKHAYRLLRDSKRAAKVTDEAVTDLRQALLRLTNQVETAERNNGVSIDEERLQAELSELQHRIRDAHNTAQAKQAAVSTAADELERLWAHVTAVHDPDRKAARRLAQAITNLAILLAGQANNHLSDTWRADLVGAPEEGRVLSPRERLAYAVGLIVAAIRIRTTALTHRLWAPVDWVLVSSRRADALITALVGLVAIYLAQTLHDLLTVASGPCALIFTLLKAGTAWLRRVRGIELQASIQSRERVDEQS